MRKLTTRGAVAVLLGLVLLVGAGNLAATYAEVHAVNASRTADRDRFCLTLGKLAALKPPPGNPATNPSRRFDDKLHATLAGLGPDLQCGKAGS